MYRKIISLFLLILSFSDAQYNSFVVPLDILYPQPNEIILIEPKHSLGLAEQKKHTFRRAYHALSQQCIELIGYNAQDNPQITQNRDSLIFKGSKTTIKALILKSNIKKDGGEFILHLKMLSCDSDIDSRH